MALSVYIFRWSHFELLFVRYWFEEVLHIDFFLFSDDKEDVLTQANAFQKACFDEVFYLNTCRDCFKNSNERADWFTTVCQTPHLLVWAKTEQLPYWPAKVFTVKGNLIGVRYFGNHERSFIPQNNIYLFTRKSPNQSMSSEDKN